MPDETEKLTEVFQLTPMQSNLLGLLMARPTVTNAMIRKITLKPKALMFRLRQHLHGIEIHSRRYVGYWIEDKDKDRIRAYLAAKLEDA